MEANDFLGKIKANDSDKDDYDLAKLYNDYKTISSKLSSKDRGSFALNVLCLLCRNLDKAPKWRDSIDAKELLTLSIDCVRETRGLNKPEQVKTLACIYHIHRFVVRKNTPIPPEFILKLSFMPFEPDAKNLLKEYSKTYWNIVVDRLSYIEKLKGKSIHKLLPKLSEDIIKTIEIYDTAQFCVNVIVFLVKKLHFLYSESYSVILNSVYKEIFEKLSRKSDLTAFKKLKDKDMLDMYMKFSDCLYVIAENSSKNSFKDSSLSVAVRSVITLLGNRSDVFHCLQTFYLNAFCDIFENKTTYIDSVFKNLLVSCEITEKLGYKSTMIATYPFIGQFLRLFIEYSVNNSIKINFTQEAQEMCLNFMLKLMSELKNCDQLLKCENCHVKSGLHDALRLSFSLKHFINNSVQSNADITTLLDLYNMVINQQYIIINELKNLGCVNYEKCYRKLQTDTHNTAIYLNKNQKYQFSIQLFDIYIKNELKTNVDELEHKNVCRAFYNRSICELDCKMYENALLNAYLSLVFAKELNTEKYMSLVMDIKAKALKCDERNEELEKEDAAKDLQLISVVEACRIVFEKQLYGDLTEFFKDVKFSLLLKHEFNMYGKLWPSIVPIAGVWMSLNSLLEGRSEKWMSVENTEELFWTLLEIISLTHSTVRSIQNEHFKLIVTKQLDMVENMPEPISSDLRVVQTTLLFLQAKYDIADASDKYGWKATEPCMDPDVLQSTRTLSQEHEALRRAMQAVEVWTELASVIETVTVRSHLIAALHLAEIYVQLLQLYSRTAHSLQLAHVCCKVAQFLDEKVIFIRNAGVIMSHIDKPNAVLQDMMTAATEVWADVVTTADGIEPAIVFLCDAATHYCNVGSLNTSAKLVRLAQANILKAYENNADINLDLAVGRLMEVQGLVCRDSGPSIMSTVTSTQRHYLSVSNTGRAKAQGCARIRAGACVVRAARALRLARRAAGGAAAALPGAPAAARARLSAHILDVYDADDAQVKIDNRLKYILGLPTSTERPVEQKAPMFVPERDFETMLRSQARVSPSRKYVSIPGFETPEAFEHGECECYACVDLNYPIIWYITAGLEASMHFRSNEHEIARNYFKGVINTFSYFNKILKRVLKSYSDDLLFEAYIVDHVKCMFEDEFRRVKLQILIEASYFELRTGRFDEADDYIVTIHEIVQELKTNDSYLSNEIMNLLIASSKLRQNRNILDKQTHDLEMEFDNLKLSPVVEPEAAKTPESKAKLPQHISARKVKDEELPKKRKVIKLDLDEHSSDEKETKPRKPAAQFKIPVPVTSKPVLEALTPRVTRKPAITVTDTTGTPSADKTGKFAEFFTPQSTPEQFFTPLNTIRTYSKSNPLRKGLVKNLEQEFSTPKSVVEKVEKENAKLEPPSRSGRKADKDRALRRATSPGKLTDTRTRPRRLRQPKLNDE